MVLGVCNMYASDYRFRIRYPQCLHFLELLQSEAFRSELANAQCTKFIEEQQLLHWHHYTKKRMLYQQQISKRLLSSS